MGGMDHVELILEDNKKLSGKLLKVKLGEAYPQLLPLLCNCRLAVNYEFIDPEEVIDFSSAEVALIGMVSGG